MLLDTDTLELTVGACYSLINVNEECKFSKASNLSVGSLEHKTK